MSLQQVVERRVAQRAESLRRAQEWVEEVRGPLCLVAAVVFGSVARGDFNKWSDTDVLLIREDETRTIDGIEATFPPAGVQEILWSSSEWRRRVSRRDPIAVDALATGVWLVGAPSVVA